MKLTVKSTAIAIGMAALPATAMATPVTVSATGVLSVYPTGHTAGLYTVAANQGDYVGLMTFDLSGYRVASAGTLTLAAENNFYTKTPSKTETVYLYSLGAAYSGSSTVTSLTASSGLPGTMIASDVASFPSGDSSFETLTFTIPQVLLASWADAPGTNYGIAVEGSPLTSFTGANHSDLLYSSSTPPALSFDVAVPEPMSVFTFVMGLLGLWFARFRLAQTDHRAGRVRIRPLVR